MLPFSLPEGSLNTTDSFETLFEVNRFVSAVPYRQSKSQCRLKIPSKFEPVE
jgi:hypothetical protein